MSEHVAGAVGAAVALLGVVLGHLAAEKFGAKKVAIVCVVCGIALGFVVGILVVRA